MLTLLCNWDALKCTQHICQLIQQAANFAGEAAQHGLPIMTSCCLQSHAQTSECLICQTLCLGCWWDGRLCCKPCMRLQGRRVWAVYWVRELDQGVFSHDTKPLVHACIHPCMASRACVPCFTHVVIPTTSLLVGHDRRVRYHDQEPQDTGARLHLVTSVINCQI